ncbi:hypothetical protein FGO68_gene15175 [Halteria grandinella]|uniref:Uncharacterized protein n=1 Tax=Halteria grandinella TaxID=5974 RepID=A0A8J8NGA8_HALGN|nr:hypothetical protein FGO68_gene15175 [Halteria grandinella]
MQLSHAPDQQTATTHLRLQDRILGFRSSLDLATQTRLLQKLSQEKGEQIHPHQTEIRVLLESLSKRTAAQKEAQAEETKDQQPSFKSLNNPESSPEQVKVEKEEQKRQQPPQQVVRTAYVCAISENELNKVELAYFKRPLPPSHSLILSDKDANRIIKDKDAVITGQPIPNAAANLLIGLPNEEDPSVINGAQGGSHDPATLDQAASGVDDMLENEVRSVNSESVSYHHGAADGKGGRKAGNTGSTKKSQAQSKFCQGKKSASRIIAQTGITPQASNLGKRHHLSGTLSEQGSALGNEDPRNADSQFFRPGSQYSEDDESHGSSQVQDIEAQIQGLVI